MKLAIQGGGTLEVSDDAFGAKFNEALIHQVVTAYMAGGRAGTKAQKTRAEVRGGGRKPFKQKGSGRARAGTIRGPIWVGGGRAFAARPRDYAQKVNRKMPTPKTKELVKYLQGFNLDQVLIVVEEGQDNLRLSARNLHSVEVVDVRELNPVSLVRFGKVLATSAAVKAVSERLS
jgi:large subunit ribosomal protein L4